MSPARTSLATAAAALPMVTAWVLALTCAATASGQPSTPSPSTQAALARTGTSLASDGAVQRVARLDPATAARVSARTRAAPARTAPQPLAGPCRLAWAGGGSQLACGEVADGRLFVTPQPVAADDPLLRIAEADADVAMALRSLHRIDGDLFQMDGGELVVRSVGRDRVIDMLTDPDATQRRSPVLSGEARFDVDVAWTDADRRAATIRLRPLADNPRRESAGALVEYERGDDGRYRLRHWRLL